MEEPTFNSNILFKKTDLFFCFSKIEIYDMCSMRVKGTITTGNKPNNLLSGCIYIKDYKIVAILKQKTLELYDFESLKLIGIE